MKLLSIIESLEDKKPRLLIHEKLSWLINRLFLSMMNYHAQKLTISCTREGIMHKYQPKLVHYNSSLIIHKS